jgi:DNA-binding NtrC family response regulator
VAPRARFYRFGKEPVMVWPPQILIIDQESGERDKLQKIFTASGVRVFCYSTLLETESFLSGQPVNAIFAETPLPDGDFRALRAEVERYRKGVPIIVLSRNMDWDQYLAAMGAGAFDCLSLPANTLEAKRVLWSALQAFSTTSSQEPVAA